MYQNVQTSILEVNSARISIKLLVDIVYGLPSHTQRARLQTCIAVTKNTQMHEGRRRYTRGVGYIPTLAVLTYNTMIYYPKLNSNYFDHCWETWRHLTSSQLPSGLFATPMLKWRGYRKRIVNQNKTSGFNALIV